MSTDIRIGGTMAANIMGVGFKSRYAAWAELTGKVEREDISDLEHVEAGTFMEDAAARWFEHRTGIPVSPSPGLVADKEFSWLAGSPDRMLDLASGRGVLECKNTHGFARRDWATDSESLTVPLGYQVQLQTYLRITGLEVGYFAAIVGGNHLETPRMERDEAFIAAMLEELQRFISDHVVRDIPPEVEARDLDVIRRLWPRDTGRSMTVSASDPAAIALQEMLRCKREIKALEEAKDKSEAVLKAAMADATEIVTPDAKATWKVQVSNFSARPARIGVETRVLRTKE